MKTNTVKGILISTLAILAGSGCTFTKIKLTGTEGATFSGYYRMTDDDEKAATIRVGGKLPRAWSQADLCFFAFVRLEECEFRKADTNTSLVVSLKTHGFRGDIAAPAGVTGIRFKHDGKNCKTETF